MKKIKNFLFPLLRWSKLLLHQKKQKLMLSCSLLFFDCFLQINVVEVVLELWADRSRPTPTDRN